MKNLFLILIFLTLLYSCKPEGIDEPNQTQLEFTRLCDFRGEQRRYTAYFELNNNLYLGLGECHNDFWMFELSTQRWLQLPDFRGVPHKSIRISFSTNGSGYIFGSDDCRERNDTRILWELWKFTPENSWDTITMLRDPHPMYLGPSFINGQYFKIDDTAYALAAYSYNPNDTVFLYAYNATLNTWFRKKDFQGFRFERSAIFTIGKKAYIGLPYTGSPPDETLNPRAFWEYNSETDTWKQLNDFPRDYISLPISFSLKGKGYIVGGRDVGPDMTPLTDIWEYTPETDTWEKIGDAPTGFFNAQTITVGDSSAYIYQADYYYEASCLPGGFWKVSVK